ncbi:MAG TPA: bifunctional DNA-formamidopyrimidine glycosylase/DNA-(apurinic or apyrimidinic site) lyase [Candidatus Magasanikbacteria bacterium]|nr:bifunctional DNA-formamidopyrimidine glycosylase/DNA-(apurinic or apyrimidinic site) lyase [Candidatus Magasanikbacteria bacterium]
MPELPEVETIKQDLKERIVNKQITSVLLSKKAIIKNKRTDFIKEIKNNKFTDILRIGKLIIFVLASKKYMLVHLKMTGQLIYQQGKDIIAGGHPEPDLEKLPNKFTRIIFEFKNGSKLYFNDIRRFGYMQIVDEVGLNEIKNKFGLEPIDKKFTFEYFQKIFENKNKPIKVALMDQDKIAGIGNIYASEICFEAKIKPARKAKNLSIKELKALYLASKKVLQVAIKNRGTTFSDYVDATGHAGYNISFLKVYDRKGMKCKRRDGGIINKIILGGRGSFYCPKCQK